MFAGEHHAPSTRVPETASRSTRCCPRDGNSTTPVRPNPDSGAGIRASDTQSVPFCASLPVGSARTLGRYMDCRMAGKPGMEYHRLESGLAQRCTAVVLASANSASPAFQCGISDRTHEACSHARSRVLSKIDSNVAPRHGGVCDRPVRAVSRGSVPRYDSTGTSAAMPRLPRRGQYLRQSRPDIARCGSPWRPARPGIRCGRPRGKLVGFCHRSCGRFGDAAWRRGKEALGSRAPSLPGLGRARSAVCRVEIGRSMGFR